VTSDYGLYVLHHGVAARWWLWHLDMQREASRFLDESLRSGAARVLAVEDIAWRALAAIAADVGAARLAGGIAGPLFDDVTALFRELIENGALALERRDPLARESFGVAAFRGMALDDATSAVLADRTGLPLLVADRLTAAQFQAIADDRTTFRVVTLGDLATGA
jgi:hypothetical protein